jgi:hypothetical protein
VKSTDVLAAGVVLVFLQPAKPPRQAGINTTAAPMPTCDKKVRLSMILSICYTKDTKIIMCSFRFSVNTVKV